MTSKFENGNMPGDEARIAALRNAIARAFPAMPYSGPITCCDGAWLPELTEENAIHDDDMFVHDALQGRTWPEIADDIFKVEPDGFVLLTHDAFVAYVAAWLVRALDNISGENKIRELVIYSFSPSPDLYPDMTDHKANMIRALNPEQQTIVRSLMAEFAECESSSFIREHARNGVAFIDGLRGS